METATAKTLFVAVNNVVPHLMAIFLWMTAVTMSICISSCILNFTVFLFLMLFCTILWKLVLLYFRIIDFLFILDYPVYLVYKPFHNFCTEKENFFNRAAYIAQTNHIEHHNHKTINWPKTATLFQCMACLSYLTKCIICKIFHIFSTELENSFNHEIYKWHK